MLVLEMVGIVASVLSFLHIVRSLWKGTPRPREAARRLATQYVWAGVALVLVSSATTLSLQAAKRVGTYQQSGQIGSGRTDRLIRIYYPVPYEGPPNLSFENPRGGALYSDPDLVEQRADGFSVSLNSADQRHLTWRAVGVPRR